jgi:hypothetical protein
VTTTAELDAATVEGVLAFDLPAHATMARRSYANDLDLLLFRAAQGSLDIGSDCDASGKRELTGLRLAPAA